VAEVSKLIDIKYNSNKAKVEKAYKDYLDGKPDAESNFFITITKFAKSKVTWATSRLDEVDKTPDDYAQDTAVYIWKKLPTFVGEPGEFFAWLSRICYVTGANAATETIKILNSRVPLLVDSEDEPGFLEENPLISSRYRYEDTPAVRLPKWIQGKDKLICGYIESGYSYKEIGTFMAMTKNAVEIRIKRIRNKVEKLNAASKKTTQ
jgi:DNA-directed RNA polymerase specialized sigma24 family protein